MIILILQRKHLVFCENENSDISPGLYFVLNKIVILVYFNKLFEEFPGTKVRVLQTCLAVDTQFQHFLEPIIKQCASQP